MDDVKNMNPLKLYVVEKMDYFLWGYNKAKFRSAKWWGNHSFWNRLWSKIQVSHILNEYGFKDVLCIKDLAGKDRVIKARKY